MAYNKAMMIPTWLMYMQAGAYAAIMFAVIGVPQLLSSYFDYRTRRRERQEAESNAERRHRELMEERREEREERRQEFALQRQESEQRHEALMTLLISNMNNGPNRRGEPPDGETIRAMQETIDALESENARLRQQNGHNGGNDAAE